MSDLHSGRLERNSSLQKLGIPLPATLAETKVVLDNALDDSFVQLIREQMPIDIFEVMN